MYIDGKAGVILPTIFDTVTLWSGLATGENLDHIFWGLDYIHTDSDIDNDTSHANKLVDFAQISGR